MRSDLWQLVLVDALFLCLAGGLALWMRALLRVQRVELGVQLKELEAQSRRLERLQVRLETACGRLERKTATGPAEGDPAVRRAESRPSSGSGKSAGDDRYQQAWRRLGQGEPAAAVARHLGLGMAEVELMGRIQRYRQQT